MSKTETKIKIKPNIALQEPPMYKIIYMNDEVTSMEFVVGSLIDYFNYTQDTASNITVDIHENGSAVVAVLPHEIAEQKGKHGELQFDWKKLNSEKHSLHTDLIDNEKECASIRDETSIPTA